MCTALWLALKRLSEMWTKPGERFHIKRLHLQLDNCVSENKNNIVMTFIGGLVAAGVIGFAEVCFLIVGHTDTRTSKSTKCFLGEYPCNIGAPCLATLTPPPPVEDRILGVPPGFSAFNIVPPMKPKIYITERARK